MASMKTIKDYLFVDTRRVTEYYEQIRSGSTMLKVEKASTWEVAASLPALGAKGSETVEFRAPTTTEQLREVERYIEKNYRLNRNRQRRGEREPFERQSFTAVRALLRNKHPVEIPGFRWLAVWLQDSEEVEREKQAIYLIEGCPDADGDVPMLFSGYSALDFLVHNLEGARTALRQSLLPTGKSDGLDFHTSSSFAQDPPGYLAALGATLGRPRRILSLFRVRLVFADFQRKEKECLGVIGYPVYIAGAEPPA